MTTICEVFNSSLDSCPPSGDWDSRDDAEELVTEHLGWTMEGGGKAGGEG